MNVGAETQTTATSTQTVTTPMDRSTALVKGASLEMELNAKVYMVKDLTQNPLLLYYLNIVPLFIKIELIHLASLENTMVLCPL